MLRVIHAIELAIRLLTHNINYTSVDRNVDVIMQHR